MNVHLLQGLRGQDSSSFRFVLCVVSVTAVHYLYSMSHLVVMYPRSCSCGNWIGFLRGSELKKPQLYYLTEILLSCCQRFGNRCAIG